MGRFARIVATGILLASVGCQTEGETVGPEGGVVTSRDGRFTITIPEGALDGDVALTLEEVPGPDGAAGPTYELSPRGTSFLYPAMVEYDLTGEGMEDLDMSAASLIGEKEHGWGQLADHAVDVEDRVVVASAMYAAAYTIVVED